MFCVDTFTLYMIIRQLSVNAKNASKNSVFSTKNKVTYMRSINVKKTSTEKALEKALCKDVTSLGGLCIKLWPISLIGLPDRLVLLSGGRLWFAEIKDEGGQLRPAQVVATERISRLGFKVRLINSMDTLFDFKKEMRECN